MADIVATLRERPYRLASESNTEMLVRRQAEREYAAHEIEVLRLEKAKLTADNERLRLALEQIIKLDDEWVPEAQDDYTYTGYQVCADVARSALNPAKD